MNRVVKSIEGHCYCHGRMRKFKELNIIIVVVMAGIMQERGSSKS